VEVLLPLVLLLAVLYVLMIRPQRRRQMDHQRMIEGAGVGEDVLTTGGIYGTVVDSDGDDIVVEIADGVTVHMTRKGIAAVLPPEEDEAGPEEEPEEGADEAIDGEEPGELSEKGEALVTTGEVPVTSEVGEDATSAERR
jgi:preprotein translocase subunit YajC